MRIPKPVRQLKDRITKEVNGKIESIVLYGSVARGTATKDSDIDIFILTKGNIYDKKNSNLHNKISDIRTDVDLENRTLTSLVYVPKKTFFKRYTFDPFIKNVIKEGVVLYDKGVFAKVSRGSPRNSGRIIRRG